MSDNYRDPKVTDTGKTGGGIGRWILIALAVLAIIALLAWLFGAFDTDVETVETVDPVVVEEEEAVTNDVEAVVVEDEPAGAEVEGVIVEQEGAVEEALETEGGILEEEVIEDPAGDDPIVLETDVETVDPEATEELAPATGN